MLISFLTDQNETERIKHKMILVMLNIILDLKMLKSISYRFLHLLVNLGELTAEFPLLFFLFFDFILNPIPFAVLLLKCMCLLGQLIRDFINVPFIMVQLEKLKFQLFLYLHKNCQLVSEWMEEF